MQEPATRVNERPSVARDALVILMAAGGLFAFYALFKAVSILAGLPFP